MRYILSLHKTRKLKEVVNESVYIGERIYKYSTTFNAFTLEQAFDKFSVNISDVMT